ncbi:hypothetical protein BaRGS_00010970 [Batillaria attramentaria]|uniref:Uncharacterized protein n=1 Tax=Batillaria attramentaria TaxID=370345 RepID=A0ABD0LF67_9CAEN
MVRRVLFVRHSTQSALRIKAYSSQTNTTTVWFVRKTPSVNTGRDQFMTTRPSVWFQLSPLKLTTLEVVDWRKLQQWSVS